MQEGPDRGSWDCGHTQLPFKPGKQVGRLTSLISPVPLTEVPRDPSATLHWQTLGGSGWMGGWGAQDICPRGHVSCQCAEQVGGGS